ncbi:hypothetical protein [Ferrovum myxofaciens]|uniref:Uncharacterized protein n=1 Tax=Ferrovum myxofaciens TaxID=416213 RepID=A0A9E6SX97_9PROT|nr:hypothetical protein [Ferrovum myxofaciens]QSH81874.1 MAG: hypothetical protein HO273_14000 [Ferrovum myxofaciens]QWY74431.1 MAG: hypothetical protein JVY19_11595 [Ferrovum myxofaciens]QWY77182.1 MAG: hypothetical protein JZL65_12040 [Ferrovum myxofaciens]
MRLLLIQCLDAWRWGDPARNFEYDHWVSQLVAGDFIVSIPACHTQATA